MTSQSSLFQYLTHLSPSLPYLAKVPASTVGDAVFSDWIDGILLLTEDGKYVDGNRLGRRICDRIAQETLSDSPIPNEIWQTCQILIKSRRRFPKHLATAESELKLSHHCFRIRARWFNAGQMADPHILVILENQTTSKQNLATTEAIQYALSPREADVWKLHRLGYTYQEIAQELHIALNTVKKHMKNTYAKQNLVSILEPSYRDHLAS